LLATGKNSWRAAASEEIVSSQQTTKARRDSLLAALNL